MVLQEKPYYNNKDWIKTRSKQIFWPAAVKISTFNLHILTVQNNFKLKEM